MSSSTDGDDEAVAGVLDCRCFAQRVYDMITMAQEVQEWRSVVKWETGGSSFSMAKSSNQLSDLVSLQFENLNSKSLQIQLEKHGFRKVSKSSTHDLFFHQKFKRGMSEDKKRSIKAVLASHGGSSLSRAASASRESPASHSSNDAIASRQSLNSGFREALPSAKPAKPVHNPPRSRPRDRVLLIQRPKESAKASAKPVRRREAGVSSRNARPSSEGRQTTQQLDQRIVVKQFAASRAPQEREIVVIDDNDAEDDADKGGSDSEIEFLYTCPPPTKEQPKEQSPTRQAQALGNTTPSGDSDIPVCTGKKRKRVATKTVMAQASALREVPLTKAPIVFERRATTPKNGDAVAAALPLHALTEAKKPRTSTPHKSTGLQVAFPSESSSKMARSSQQLIADMTLKPGTPKLASPRHQPTQPRGNLLSGSISESEDSKSITVVHRKLSPLNNISESEDSKRPALVPRNANQDSSYLDNDSDSAYEPDSTEEEPFPTVRRELPRRVDKKRPPIAPVSDLNASPSPPAMSGTGRQGADTDAKQSGVSSVSFRRGSYVTSTSTQAPRDQQQDSHVDVAARAASIMGGQRAPLSSVPSERRTGPLLKDRLSSGLESSNPVSGVSRGTPPAQEHIDEFHRKLRVSASSARGLGLSDCVGATERRKRLLRLRTSASGEDRAVLPQRIPSDDYLSSSCVESDNMAEQRNLLSDDAFWPAEAPNGATAEAYAEASRGLPRDIRPGTNDEDSDPSKRVPQHNSTTRPSNESPSAMDTTRTVQCSESLSPDKAASATLPRHAERMLPPTKKKRSSPDDSENLQRLIRRHWTLAQHENESRHQDLTKKLLEEKRDAVIRKASKKLESAGGNKFFPKDLMSRTVVATTSKSRKGLVVTGFGNGKLPVPSNILVGSDDPQPRHNNPIILTKLYSIMDDTTLRFVPYFSELNDEVEKILSSEYFDTSEREKRLCRGALHCEERSIQDIDLAVQRICDELRARDPSEASVVAKMEELRILRNVFVNVIGVDADLFQERFDLLIPKGIPASQKTTSGGDAPQSDDDWNQYLQSADTYRTMFCNRCFVYNCNLHGQYEKPTVQLQHERAMLREVDGYWESVEFGVPAAPTHDKLHDNIPTHLTASQEALCKRMFVIFHGDASRIAKAMELSTKIIETFITSKQLRLPTQTGALFKKPKNTTARRPAPKYHSMKNYKPTWLQNICKAQNHPWCSPCVHDGPCSEDSCQCVESAVFCTKACGQGEYSPNFFRGCDCKTDCRRQSCPCFAAGRECDPDLCKSCGACTDPANSHCHPKQKCRNDNISMRRNCRLLVGTSTVPGAGWGLFTMMALKKGDFLQEYLGEILTQQEGERRGLLCDQRGCSYLFNQSSDYVVDAMLKGNKVRFGNHSKTPNVETKRLFVNGDLRIGFFANQDIAAQSELFVNYDKNFKYTWKKEG